MMKNYFDVPPLSMLQPIYFIFSSIFLLSCLLNVEVFISNSLFNYFAFVFGASGIVILVFFSNNHRINIVEKITIPFLFFLLWLLFVFFQKGESIQYKTYKIASCFIFIASFIILRKDKVAIFYKAVTFVSTIEGLWCILQYLGKIPSESEYFKITGSFANPNVVAIFMALSLPAVLCLCFKTINSKLKIVYYLMLIIVCVGLLLLKCRTALIGGLFSSILFLIFYFGIIKRFKSKYLYLIILLLLIVSIPIAKQLYHNKKESADGRKLIWNISLQMILDSPLRGYGIGMFEREYNLKQAEAINKDKLTQAKQKNASFVLMAYNDYLEQSVEGGIPAGVLFIVMLLLFLYLPPKKEKTTNSSNTKDDFSTSYYVAYCGIASFTLMAFFNFIINAIPAMILFCVYAAILCANNSTQKRLYHFSIKSQTAKVLLSVLVCYAFYVLYNQTILVKNNLQVKKALDLLNKGSVETAEELLLPLKKSQQNSINYCIAYGSLLYIQERYEEALEQFNCAKKFSSNPELYDLAAKCEFNLKNKEGTITNLYLASALSPKTMRYKFGLMQLLFRSNRLQEACKIARKIISMKPEKPNEQTNKYQKKAQELLKHYQLVNLN